jgi:hypothetical protein
MLPVARAWLHLLAGHRLTNANRNANRMPIA